jgi:hypothetical protein
MKKLVLNKETLKVLSPSDTSRVQGGAPPRLTELDGCTLGTPCTDGCTRTSANCWPMTVLNGCGP